MTNFGHLYVKVTKYGLLLKDSDKISSFNWNIETKLRHIFFYL